MTTKGDNNIRKETSLQNEIELERLEKRESPEKKSKSLALKTIVKAHDSNQEDESQYTSDKDDALIKKFEKFLRKERTKEINQKKVPKWKITCFEYEKKDMSKVNAIHFKRITKSKEIRIKGQRRHI